MKCKRIELECEVEKYEVGKNLEDGFERFTDVITKGWINTEGLIQVTREDGTLVCPYISQRRGKTFIKEGDYIITEADGFKNVCGEDRLWKRFAKL